MTYEFYKVMHLVGLFMAFSAIGAYVFGALGSQGRQFPGKKLAGLVHGIGLLLAFVSGFGLLARLGMISGWPGWVYLKLLIWLLVGAVVALIVRKPSQAKAVWLATLIIGGFAAYLARYKPF